MNKIKASPMLGQRQRRSSKIRLTLDQCLGYIRCAYNLSDRMGKGQNKCVYHPETSTSLEMEVQLFLTDNPGNPEGVGSHGDQEGVEGHGDPEGVGIHGDTEGYG